MQPTTLVDLSDVQGTPRVKMTLPVPLRAGDRVKLAFRLRRLNGGRQEILDVVGDFRVSSATLALDYQVVAVESVGKAPTWRAVRKDIVSRRQLPPAVFPRTVL